jgi:hypothetical protein
MDIDIDLGDVMPVEDVVEELRSLSTAHQTEAV